MEDLINEPERRVLKRTDRKTLHPRKGKDVENMMDEYLMPSAAAQKRAAPDPWCCDVAEDNDDDGNDNGSVTARTESETSVGMTNHDDSDVCSLSTFAVNYVIKKTKNRMASFQKRISAHAPSSNDSDSSLEFLLQSSFSSDRSEVKHIKKKKKKKTKSKEEKTSKKSSKRDSTKKKTKGKKAKGAAKKSDLLPPVVPEHAPLELEEANESKGDLCVAGADHEVCQEQQERTNCQQSDISFSNLCTASLVEDSGEASIPASTVEENVDTLPLAFSVPQTTTDEHATILLQKDSDCGTAVTSMNKKSSEMIAESSIAHGLSLEEEVTVEKSCSSESIAESSIAQLLQAEEEEALGKSDDYISLAKVAAVKNIWLQKDQQQFASAMSSPPQALSSPVLRKTWKRPQQHQVGAANSSKQAVVPSWFKKDGPTTVHSNDDSVPVRSEISQIPNDDTMGPQRATTTPNSPITSPGKNIAKKIAALREGFCPAAPVPEFGHQPAATSTSHRRSSLSNICCQLKPTGGASSFSNVENPTKARAASPVKTRPAASLVTTRPAASPVKTRPAVSPVKTRPALDEYFPSASVPDATPASSLSSNSSGGSSPSRSSSPARQAILPTLSRQMKRLAVSRCRESVDQKPVIADMPTGGLSLKERMKMFQK